MNRSKKQLIRFVLTVGVGGAILISAALAAAVMIARREPPAQTVPPEPSLAVEVVRAEQEDVSMLIVGHGEARPIETVPVAPQISGVVARVHERLFAGEVISAGEPLFEIESRDYENRVAQARAQAAQARSGLARLHSQYASDRERLHTLERNRELARNDFERMRDLFENESVGALANVERVEQVYNQTRDAFDVMTQNVSLYPSRIVEAEQGLAATEAALQLAETSLERTVISAHFDARIQDKRVEQGQYVTPGAPVLTLANDSILEIAVPLDSRDVRAGLQFADSTAAVAENSWFGTIVQTPCRVFWTEAPDSHYWEGVLDRIVAFDQHTRTVTAAIRVTAENARAGASALPLVAGMFCRVEIPGATMLGVYRLPRLAVTFENEVYLAENGRLMPRQVEVLRAQHDQAFINAGLHPEELIIITRLVNPLPNTRIDYDETAIVSTRTLKETAAPEDTP